jgi:hypothetical protein
MISNFQTSEPTNLVSTRDAVKLQTKNAPSLKLVTLLDILTIYAEVVSQPKPYLLKDGLKIIF